MLGVRLCISGFWWDGLVIEALHRQNHDIIWRRFHCFDCLYLYCRTSILRLWFNVAASCDPNAFQSSI